MNFFCTDLFKKGALTCAIIFATSSAVVAETPTENMIVILDGSGSMWGQIEGRTKIEIARDVMADLLPTIDQNTRIGLMSYGHRFEGRCDDIETLVAPQAVGDVMPSIVAGVNGITPTGKTPLTQSVIDAAEALEYATEKATVVLITDGLETCDADPCAAAQRLEDLGLNFTTHVIGFGLSDTESEEVACLATQTGGQYIQAADAGRLGEALSDVFEPIEQKVSEQLFIQLFDTPSEENVISHRDQRHGFSDITIYSTIDFAARQNAIEGNYTTLPHGIRQDRHTDAVFSGQLEPGSYVALAIYNTSGARYEVPLPFSVSPDNDPIIRLYAGMSSINPKIVHVEGGRDWGFGGSGSDYVKVNYYPIFTDGSGEIIESQQSVLRDKGPIPPGQYMARGQLGQARLAQQITVAPGIAWTQELIFNAALFEVSFIHPDGAPVDGSIVVRFCSAEPREAATAYEDCRGKHRPTERIHVNVGETLRLALNRERQWNRTQATEIVEFPDHLAGTVIQHEITVGDLAFGSMENEFALFGQEVQRE